jgi:hypothetical protein
MTISFTIPAKLKALLIPKYLFIVVGTCLLLGLAFANFYASMRIPHLYVEHVENERAVIATYLAAIRPLPQFQASYVHAVNAYGTGLHDELNKADNIRNRKIINLEQELQFNPNNRDILYALSVLYKENRDFVKSREYVKRFQQIDPLYHPVP